MQTLKSSCHSRLGIRADGHRVSGRSSGRTGPSRRLNNVVASASDSDDVCSVTDPTCSIPDPEQQYRRYGKFFGKMPGWLQGVPRVRVRSAAQVSSIRQQDELLELTVLNEKLAGNRSWEIRQELEYLKKSRKNWERIFEYVTKQDADATLELIEEANRKVGLLSFVLVSCGGFLSPHRTAAG
jgi:hypothetical protein